ncbi:MAG TPA: polysaccharide deacetylase family protein [Parafilimonas sp.]|nr:polysaccharide deacetylase family protein [Parafilimonas sp.]
MKKTGITIFIVALMLHTLHAQTKPARLIIRGDDMGFSHAGNTGIIECFRNGIETSVEVLAPSPWFPEAVQLLKENPTVDVGIHLTLTSEWDNLKWRPLTDCPSLKDADGYFYPMIWTNKNYPGKNLLAHTWRLDEIEKEWRAQIELALREIPRISHISGHMGCTNMNDTVHALARKLAKEYHIDIDLKGLDVAGTSYVGAHTTSAEKKSAFIKMLDTLKAGKTYLFVDHPATASPEMKAIHHIGYENVEEDRQGVVDLFTDKEIKDLIRQKNIQLISYKNLTE